MAPNLPENDLQIKWLHVCKQLQNYKSIMRKCAIEAERNTKNGEEDHESGWYLNYPSASNACYSQQTGILPIRIHRETVSISDKDSCFRIRKSCLFVFGVLIFTQTQMSHFLLQIIHREEFQIPYKQRTTWVLRQFETSNRERYESFGVLFYLPTNSTAKHRRWDWRCTCIPRYSNICPCGLFHWPHKKNQTHERMPQVF